jgi:membrane protein implicated in regulation of membrane protease activity
VARLKPFSDRPLAPGLYRKHLTRLAITLGIGYALAVLPMLIRLPLDFVAFAVLTLLAMIALRRSVLALQKK